MRHQYGISCPRSSDVISQETSDGIAKCLLFSQANFVAVQVPQVL